MGDGRRKASWCWHLLSLEHRSPCWAPQEVALGCPRPGAPVCRAGRCQGGHPLLYAKGSPKPQWWLSGRRQAKGLGRQPVPCERGVCWSLVLSSAEGTEARGTSGEAGGTRAFAGSLKHSCCAWGFSSSFSIWVSPSCLEEGRGGPHLQAARVGRERPHVSTCCPPTHRRWSQRERATGRSTEACHGSPSPYGSLGCFQKTQEGQSQVLHKAGLDPHHRCSNRYT